MKRMTFAAGLALALASPALAEAEGPVIPILRTEMVQGQAQMFQAPRAFEKVSVALSETADVLVTTDHRFLVQAKLPGMTSIVLLDKGGQVVQQMDVRVLSQPEAHGRNVIRVSHPGDKKDHFYYCLSNDGGCIPDPANKKDEAKANVTVVLPDGDVRKRDTTISVPRQ